MDAIAKQLEILAKGTQKILCDNSLRGAFTKIRVTKLNEFSKTLSGWAEIEKNSVTKC
jgi:hypothetical protein